jgi:regulator of PEP synthase PpsR (kinase-PPPase family)
MNGDRPILMAVSDATGETAVQMARAALAQFGQFPDSSILLMPHISGVEDLKNAVQHAQRLDCILAYTLVQPELGAQIRKLAGEAKVVAVDLLGGLVTRLAGHFGQTPLAVPGLTHLLDADYFRRIEAVEFAVYNDDGREPANMHRADLVVVGVSRTSKTPLSNYIAHRGYKVANVPLILDIPPPKELDEIDPRRVFGLEIEPGVLAKIRQNRMATIGMKTKSDYGDLRHIRREAAWARKLFSAHPEWRVVNVTRKAVEETASVILEAYRKDFEQAESSTPARSDSGSKKKKSTKKAAGRKSSTTRAPAKKKASQKKAGKKSPAKKKAATKPVAGRTKRR